MGFRAWLRLGPKALRRLACSVGRKVTLRLASRGMLAADLWLGLLPSRGAGHWAVGASTTALRHNSVSRRVNQEVFHPNLQELGWSFRLGCTSGEGRIKLKSSCIETPPYKAHLDHVVSLAQLLPALLLLHLDARAVWEESPCGCTSTPRALVRRSCLC